MNYQAFRRRALQIAIGFLLLTAIIAIVSVLMNDFGHIQAKILATSFTISAACILAMSCAAFIEQRNRVSLGLTGIALSFCAAALLIIGLWTEISSDWYWKTTCTLIVAAVAFAHTFLLMLPKLESKQKWLQWTTACSIGLLALQIVISIWFEIGNELYFRLLTVLAILIGLQTLLVPIFMKMRKGDEVTVRQLRLKQVAGDRYRDASGKEYLVQQIEPAGNGDAP